MNTQLLNRALGSAPPRVLRSSQHARLLHALQPAHLHFHGPDGRNNDGGSESAHQVAAHSGGANSIAIDSLLSGGGDATISIYDLESRSQRADTAIPFHEPLGSILKGDSGHGFGITHLTFYPFDSLAFLSSSYDHTLKIWSSETLQASASFDLGAIVYSHALSLIASHLLVACAVQHPTVRLVDLKSGVSTHSLAGHHGAVLSVAWSPVDDHVLCSAGTDGSVRFWDVRRSSSCLAVLDLEDSLGVGGLDGCGRGARARLRGVAHTGAVNGVVWTEDGRHVVTAGHDEKVRVWDVVKGANTLANFGPVVKNSHLSTLLPLVAPMKITDAGKDVLFLPSEKETLMYELFEGRLLKRLKTPPGGGDGESRAVGNRGRNPRNRTTALAWRAHAIELYSAHADGVIRAWTPRTTEDAMVEQEEDDFAREREAERKRRRQALEDVYRDLTKRQAFA